MKKVYTHRFKVLKGYLTNQVFDGFDIGALDYPTQVEVEGKAMGDDYGVWLSEPGV